MADVIMPQMGESIAEGTVTKWLKNIGDTVERDEPLFEISTDKVDAEIPSPAAGVLREIRVPPGTTVPINTVVGLIAEEGEETAATPEPPAPAEAAPAPAPAAAPPTAAPAPTPPATASVPAVDYRLEGERSTRPVTPPTATPPAEAPSAQMSLDELRQSRSSPVVRRIAAEHRVDISTISGTGIGGRVTKQDILNHIEGQGLSLIHI